ncbi:MAG: hypothetical protein M3Y87_37255, partial [Myxococcota bacterium]|nr:hypothetical protein [Myxococcota bacterium]
MNEPSGRRAGEASVGRALLIASLALAGCDSCERGGPVPFGLDGGHGAPSTGTAPSHDPGSAAAAAGSAVVVRELPDGTLRADVEGAPIELTGESIRAIGARDLDADGDRDALIVTGGDAAHGPRVLVVMRDGRTFGAPLELASSPALSASCAVERAGVRAIG